MSAQPTAEPLAAYAFSRGLTDHPSFIDLFDSLTNSNCRESIANDVFWDFGKSVCILVTSHGQQQGMLHLLLLQDLNQSGFGQITSLNGLLKFCEQIARYEFQWLGRFGGLCGLS